MLKQIYIVLMLLFVCTAMCAQVQDPTVLSDVRKLTVQDYQNLELPPLSELLDHSSTHPAVLYYDARSAEETSRLKSIKREWLNNIKVVGSYQYGIANDMTSYMDVNASYVNQYYGKLQNMYNIGATLSIPFLEIFDRRNKLNRQKIVISATKIEALRTQDEINMKIIDAYTDALQNIALLKSTSEAATVANAQYQVTEMDFVNGKIDAQSLGRQKNIQVQSLREYELTRSALNNAILRLEVLSKTKILNR